MPCGSFLSHERTEIDLAAPLESSARHQVPCHPSARKLIFLSVTKNLWAPRCCSVGDITTFIQSLTQETGIKGRNK